MGTSISVIVCQPIPIIKLLFFLQYYIIVLVTLHYPEKPMVLTLSTGEVNFLLK
jgi:hypothetical protein